MKKLFIISNESVFNYEGKYFCNNVELKSTPEGLSKFFEVNLIARQSNKRRSHQINLDNIHIFKNFFTYLSEIFKSFKMRETKYLVYSISPYTFLACIFLRLFGKKPIVWLRSDGHEEYKAILGFLGPIIYYTMFLIVSWIAHLISCREYILKGKKGAVVLPSQLNAKWFKEFKSINTQKINLLYVGRLRIEKGIFSLFEIIKDNQEITLSVVGADQDKVHNINQSNISIFDIESNEDNLIKYYDDHNIFVLPSFTEGYPMVLLESLSRMRPVIIFEEIKHVVGDKKGIYISKRNSKSFKETVSYIKKNYQKIQEDIKQNKLPTNKDFIEKMKNLISNLN